MTFRQALFTFLPLKILFTFKIALYLFKYSSISA